MNIDTTRRSFLQFVGAEAAVVGLNSIVSGQSRPQDKPQEKPIQGFERTVADPKLAKQWKPISDRKIRVGLVGHGVCKFAQAFGFQDHPNVDVVAVSDLIPERCAGLAQAARCAKTYPSLEELVKDDKIEAVFVATDAPSHAKHCIDVLKHGKHVACAVPACFASLEQGDQLFEAVKAAKGLNYMMFETSYYHDDLYAMRQIYNAGGFGKIVYAEGEYYHYMAEPIDSYKGWRIGLPPQYYPTHSNAYFVGVTDGSFTEVSCMGMPSAITHLKPENNPYKNPFGTEIALFRSSDGGTARMAVSWDTPGVSGETGRIRGQKASFYGKYDGPEIDQTLPPLLATTAKPPLPPGVDPGSHGGSHGYLMNEFVISILQNRKPLVDIAMALNMTVSGIIAHQSAMKDGELLKIPQYRV